MNCPDCHEKMYPMPGTNDNWFICHNLKCHNFNRYHIKAATSSEDIKTKEEDSTGK